MRRRTDEELAMEILDLYAAGEDLDHATMERRHLALLRAACRRFGSWREAVEFAGLPYDQVRRRRAWSREKIVARIRELHARGEPLDWANVSRRLDPPLAWAALKPRAFGSWRAALEAAGIDPDEVCRPRRGASTLRPNVPPADQNESNGEIRRV
ncbi:MAG: hypothetical protein QHJ73_02785 [Armatimonadota bacterium]|nr:hypothetical protein [Armatimonadota bacterium]